MTAAEFKTDFKLTTDTPYLALTGEPWGSIVRILEKIDSYWLHFNGTTLYVKPGKVNAMPDGLIGLVKQRATPSVGMASMAYQYLASPEFPCSS